MRKIIVISIEINVLNKTVVQNNDFNLKNIDTTTTTAKTQNLRKSDRIIRQKTPMQGSSGCEKKHNRSELLYYSVFKHFHIPPEQEKTLH